MWRSRARLGLGAIVVALAWPAIPAIAVAGVAPPDAGTLQVSPSTVPASTQTPLSLSFTAPAIAAPAPAPVLDVTLSMPPSGQSTTMVVSPSGPGTTTMASPTAGAAHTGIDWRPILLVVLGLVLVAGTAGLAAFRPPRRGGHGTAGGSVRAVPRTGPPPSVTVRDTGDSPALTVRIEPRAGATMTTIEERVP
jgi:hypothetical protein